jgi:hypothetical protein
MRIKRSWRGHPLELILVWLSSEETAEWAQDNSWPGELSGKRVFAAMNKDGDVICLTINGRQRRGVGEVELIALLSYYLSPFPVPRTDHYCLRCGERFATHEEGSSCRKE